ncbi:MAG: IS701 family transposase [Aggregatilineales bacterium]
MLNLPSEMIALLAAFEPEFSKPVWVLAQVLLAGALLAPHKRTVTAALRAMGVSQEKAFDKYHRVLYRDKWSGLRLSRRLLILLVTTFVAAGVPVLIGIDETIERRWGPKIVQRGIYRDPVRSSKSQLVKASGLRWVSAMLIVDIPWVGRAWALPFLTVLAPSKRYDQQRGRTHRTVLDKASALVRLIRWWLPEHEIVIAGDGAYAATEFAAYLQHFKRPVTLVSRFYLDAALYGEPYAIPKGRPRLKGDKLPNPQQQVDNPASVWTRVTIPWYDGLPRPVEWLSGTALWYRTGIAPVAIRWLVVRDPLGKFDLQTFFCTLPTAAPLQILAWFILRWCVETTFEEVRAHLGVETQRQWSTLAIQRTTPLLFGLFSFVTLLTDRLLTTDTCPTRTAAWYAKPAPTFSDAIALVRRHLWLSATFCTPTPTALVHKVPPWLVERLLDTLCYAA